VLEYMRQQNRPYNAQNVFDNLHAVVPKSQVQAILDILVSGGTLVMKEYGKSKTYIAAQKGGDGDCEQEAEALQAEIAAADEALQGLRAGAEARRRAAAERRSWRDAKAGIEGTLREVAELERRVGELRAAAETECVEAVDEREMADAEEQFRASHAEWRRRKRLCMDALRNLSELMDAKVDVVIDRYGIDTDELCGQFLPEGA